MSDAAEKWKAKTQDLVLRIKDVQKDSRENSDLRLTYEQHNVLTEMLEWIEVMERADRRADDQIHSLKQHIKDLQQERSELSGLYKDGVRQ